MRGLNELVGLADQGIIAKEPEQAPREERPRFGGFGARGPKKKAEAPVLKDADGKFPYEAMKRPAKPPGQ